MTINTLQLRIALEAATRLALVGTGASFPEVYRDLPWDAPRWDEELVVAMLEAARDIWKPQEDAVSPDVSTTTR